MTAHDWIVAASGAGAWAFAGWVERRFVIPALDRRRQPARVCARKGHDWVSYGGRNASCCRDCSCSVPVHECARCGDCDYGDNAEAARTIENCELAREVRACDCQGGYDQPGDIAYRSNDCPTHGELT